MTYLNSTSTSNNSIAAVAASFFENVIIRYKRYRIYRTTFNEMNLLSNRELKDLGLHRAGLREVAWESAQNAKV